MNVGECGRTIADAAGFKGRLDACRGIHSNDTPMIMQFPDRARRLDAMTAVSHHRGVDRRKTTVYLDSEVLTATKVLAAARERTESQVVEDALRAYLRTSDVEVARADLRALMDRLAQRADLDDEAAMAVAVEEVRAARAVGQSSSTR